MKKFINPDINFYNQDYSKRDNCNLLRLNKFRLGLVNPPKEIVFYLVDIYLKRIKEYYKANKRKSIRYPHLHFFFDYKTYNNKIVIDYLKENLMDYHFFSYENMKTCKIFSGINNTIIFDTYNFYENSSKTNLFYRFHIMLKYLYNNVYFCIPDLIFEPDDNTIYNKDSIANYSGDGELGQVLVYLSHLITYSKKVLKKNFNRIIYPYVYQHEKIAFLNERPKSDNKGLFERSILSYEELSQLILYYFENQLYKNENVIFANEAAYLSEREISKFIYKKKKEVINSKSIKLNFQNPNFNDFEMYSKQKHINMFKKLNYEFKS